MSFATELYTALTRDETIGEAMAAARQKLRSDDPVGSDMAGVHPVGRSGGEGPIRRSGMSSERPVLVVHGVANHDKAVFEQRVAEFNSEVNRDLPPTGRSSPSSGEISERPKGY